MVHYEKILAHIPHSSIADYSHKWLGGAMMFPIVKRLTDWHTEILFSSNNLKVDCMVFPHSRFYVDVERLENDPLEDIGQGKLYTQYEGFQRELTDMVKFKLNGIYHGWHKLCESHIIANTLVIDCHSFPSDMAKDIDVCIGFNDDQSKPDNEVLDFIKGKFTSCGFRVAFNAPYSNSIVFNDRHHSVMLEINKGVYMHEDTLELRPDAYKIGNVIHSIYDTLTA